MKKVINSSVNGSVGQHMRKLNYTCFYDGKICDKTKPNVEDGVVIEPTNEYCVENFSNQIDEDTLRYCWDLCYRCDRNHSISGFGRGIIGKSR